MWTRRVFQAWNKSHRKWKEQKDKEKFQLAVKLEIQGLSASYAKEIEQLRSKLEDANSQIASMTHEKATMQDNLKKAFMKGVCALSFECDNIVSPEDRTATMNRMMQDFTGHQMPQNHHGSIATDDQLSQLSYNVSESTNQDV